MEKANREIGGISFFSPRYGFTCDNVVNYEIVLANGEIVNANTTSQPELFAALKGGQNNFGIVTRFDFSTIPLPQTYGGSLMLPFNSDTKAGAIAALSNAATNHDIDDSVATLFIYSSETKGFVIYNNLFHASPDSTHFGEYTSIAPGTHLMNTMRNTTLSDLTREATLIPMSESRKDMYTLTFKPSAELITELVDSNERFLSSNVEADIKGLTVSLIFEPLPASMQAASAAKSRNENGLASLQGFENVDRHEDLMIIAVQWTWKSSSSDNDVADRLRKHLSEMKKIIRDARADYRWLYMNYANRNQNVWKSWGENAGERLRSISRKVDPQGLFQSRTGSGRFKIAETLDGQQLREEGAHDEL